MVPPSRASAQSTPTSVGQVSGPVIDFTARYTALRLGLKKINAKLLRPIALVYFVVSMASGFLLHTLVGFSFWISVSITLFYSFFGLIVILLGAYLVHLYELDDAATSFNRWPAPFALVTLFYFLGLFIQYLIISLDWQDFPRGGGPYILATFVPRGAIVLVGIIIYMMVLRNLRLREKQDEVMRLALLYKDSELSRLRAQLNPHFLFNSLGAIAADSDRPKLVELLVSSLADVLRYNLSGTEAAALFSKETNAIQSYLRMEQARLGDMLKIEMNIPVAAELCLVPQPLLLPLIENAIKYGLVTSGDFLSLKVGAEVSAGMLSVWVENSGHWVPPEPSEIGRQIGLSNLRRRLDLHFGPGDYVDSKALPESVRVSVTIPVSHHETSPSSHRRR